MAVLVKNPERVRAVVQHIVQHFKTKVEPNGFKAQVVVFDRECCVLYKAVMDELIGPEASAIVMTSAQHDPPEWKQHVRDKDAEEKLLDRFREANVGPVLDAHGYLVRLFEKLTSKGKRSLASKYLHFHRPNLFFIYDSRAMSSIRRLSVPGQVIHAPRSADCEYAAFVSKALGLREQIRAEFGAQLTPRQLDRLLLAIVTLGH